MPVTEEIIHLAEDEKLIREYRVGKVRFPAKMDAYLSVTNKRICLLAKGGMLRKSYSTNEVHVDDASGVDIMTAPKNIVIVIIGAAVLIVGLLMFLTSIGNIIGNIIGFIFGLILLIAGGVIVKQFYTDRFLFIIKTKATTTAFVMASPSVARKGVRNGFGVFIGRPCDETFQLAQEIGAVILDVREKGTTNVGEPPK